MPVKSRPNFYPVKIKNREADYFIDCYPLNTNNVITYYSARYAIRHALISLDINCNDEVLLPSYNCGVEIEALNQNSIFNIIFYNVDKFFNIDINDIKSKITRSTKLILVTHYFGFNQSLEELKLICEKRNIYLLEDCAHAFLSMSGDKWLGSYGDVSIFSFRKTLPIPDGAALVINNNNILHPVKGPKPKSLVTKYSCAERHLESLNSKLLKLFYLIKYTPVITIRAWYRLINRLCNNKIIFLVHPESNNYYKEIQNWDMSDESLAIMNKLDFVKIKNRRRDNYLLLLDCLKSIDNIFIPRNSLPDGVCPLIFPVYVKDRYLIYESMKKNGYRGHCWWEVFHPAVPWAGFSESAWMKKNLYGLSIHQDLNESLLLDMAKTFRSVVKELA